MEAERGREEGRGGEGEGEGGGRGGERGVRGEGGGEGWGGREGGGERERGGEEEGGKGGREEGGRGEEKRRRLESASIIPVQPFAIQVLKSWTIMGLGIHPGGMRRWSGTSACGYITRQIERSDLSRGVRSEGRCLIGRARGRASNSRLRRDTTLLQPLPDRYGDCQECRDTCQCDKCQSDVLHEGAFWHEGERKIGIGPGERGEAGGTASKLVR